MKLLKLLFALLLVINCISASSEIRLPEINFSHKGSKVFTKGNKLVVSTGKVERIWKLTKNGFATESIKNQITGKVWTNPKSTQTSDFSDGGLFLGPSHAIQVGTPIENIIALYKTAGSLIEEIDESILAIRNGKDLGEINMWKLF